MLNDDQLQVVLGELTTKNDRTVAVVGLALLEAFVDAFVPLRIRVVGAHN